MTKKKKKRPTYRQLPAQPRVEPRRAAPPARRGGILSGLFGGPAVLPSMSEMPLYRTSLGRGFLSAGSNPVLVLAPFLFVLGYWVLLVASGFVGPPQQIVYGALAVPPLSSSTDVGALQQVLPAAAAPWALLGLFLVRAIVVAFLAAWMVDQLETGRLSSAAPLRALRALPVVLGGLVVSFIAGLFANFASVAGPGIGTLASVAVTAAAIHFLGYLPFVAITGHRGLGDALRRSVAAARTPGGRNFMLCMLYVFVLIVMQIALSGRPLFTAQPTLDVWIRSLVITFMHVGFFATLGFRWLSVADDLPPTQPQPRRGR